MSDINKITKLADELCSENAEEIKDIILEKIKNCSTLEKKEIYPHVLTLVIQEGYEIDVAFDEADRVINELSDKGAKEIFNEMEK